MESNHSSDSRDDVVDELEVLEELEVVLLLDLVNDVVAVSELTVLCVDDSDDPVSTGRIPSDLGTASICVLRFVLQNMC